MIHPKCIIPECHADTFFIEVIKKLPPPPKGPNHKHGKTNVLKALEFIDVPKILAIIDKDPHASVKINLADYDYDLIKSDDNEHYLKLFKHKKRNYFIIEVNREFEYWLFYKIIPESKINPTESMETILQVF